MGRDGIRVSDEAVEKATGRDWDAWEALIDSWNGPELSHQEIVARVREAGVDSGWWQQMVTNAYEKLKGRREVGETQDADYQIGVQRTLRVEPEHAWRVLTSAAGVRAWLGDGGDVAFEEGARYRRADGAEGEVRVVRPANRLRMTWQPEGWPRSSTIQLRVTAKDGGKTVISFHQEHLPNRDEREARRTHFKVALAAIERLLDEA